MLWRGLPVDLLPPVTHMLAQHSAPLTHTLAQQQLTSLFSLHAHPDVHPPIHLQTHTHPHVSAAHLFTSSPVRPLSANLEGRVCRVLPRLRRLWGSVAGR